MEVNSAETVGCSDEADAPSARRAFAAGTSLPVPWSCCPCADCRGTRRDDVLPRRLPPARAWDDVVEGQIIPRGAVLAGEAIAQEDVEPGKGRMRRWLHEGFERNHARQLHLEGRAVNRVIVIGDDVHTVEKKPP